MAKSDREIVARPQSAGPLGIALIGTKFMGRAHSTAWSKATQFFDLKRTPVMQAVAGRHPAETCTFAAKWGWKTSTTNWRDLLSNPGARGKVASKQARAARKKGVHTFVWYNYRRCPAVAFAHRLVKDGRLGRIFHVRASYLQDWGGPDTPLLWRFQSDLAGSGAHGDLNAHIIDMARFITGDEVVEVVGSIEETFVKERALIASASPEISSKGAKPAVAKKTGKSTVDDALLFLARFKQGAVASFEASRLATGNQNRNCIEINGEKGSIKFDFERMNELQWWDNTLDAKLRGWSRIMCTDPTHPYASHYWPAAHLLGYEHGFISEAADICAVIAGGSPVVMLPDFEDALKTQCVLEAAIRSARERRPVPIRELDKF